MRCYLITEQHLLFMLTALDMLKSFYDGSPNQLFGYIARNYNVPLKDCVNAMHTFLDTGIACKNEKMYAACCELLHAVDNATPAEKNAEKEYKYQFCISEETNQKASKAFDFYSRVMLGQFSEFYEAALEAYNSRNEWQYIAGRQFIADMRWNAPNTLVKARNLLVPDCKGLNWNGNLGISHPKACMEAKLAYEIAKVLDEQDFEKRTGRKDCILHVSGMPFIKLKGEISNDRKK